MKMFQNPNSAKKKTQSTTSTSGKTKIVIKGGRNPLDDRFEVLKTDGNALFKERKFKEAIKVYTKCLVRKSCLKMLIFLGWDSV